MVYHGNIESQLYVRLGFLLFKLLPYTLTAKSQRGKKLMISVWTEEQFSFEFYNPSSAGRMAGSEVICICGDGQDTVQTGRYVVGREKKHHGLLDSPGSLGDLIHSKEAVETSVILSKAECIRYPS